MGIIQKVNSYSLNLKRENMFYYIQSKKPRLEINIGEKYSEADLERIFLFIEAFLDSPRIKVIFKVHPLIKEQFKKTLATRLWTPLYAYHIKENIA